MSQQIINVGEAPNDGTGEPLRSAFTAVNNNFDQVWAAGPVGSQIAISNNVISTTQTNLDLVLHANGIGNITVYNSITPWTDSVYDLGSANNQFDTVWARYYRGNASQMTGLPVVPNLSAITTDLLPIASLAYDIGSSSLRWDNIYARNGSFTGNMTIGGNLLVSGNVTYIDSNVVDIKDKNITLAYGSPNALAADGAGITIAGANAEIYYDNNSNTWTFNLPITTPNIVFPDGSVLDTANTVHIGQTPADKGDGNLWFNSDDGRGYVKYNDQWIEFCPPIIPNPATYLGNLTIDGENNSTLYFPPGGAIEFGDGSVQTTAFTGTVDLANVASNIVPAANVTYSLGNSTNQWKDLWVSNSTIYINSVPLTVDGTTLQVDGANVVTASANGVVDLADVSVTGNVAGNVGAFNDVNLNNAATNKLLYTDSNRNIYDTGFGYNDNTNEISGVGNITAGYFVGNGSQLTGLPASYSNADVSTFLADFGSNSISTTGNISGGNIRTGGNVDATSAFVNAGAVITSGYIQAGTSMSAAGNITGNYFIGNGSQLTAINANTIDVLNTNGLTTTFYPTFVENRDSAAIVRADVDLTYRTDTNTLGVGNLSAAGNITGTYFIGNGSQLTGLPAGYTNANLANIGANNISTTGNITAGNVIGNISVVGNLFGSSANVTITAGSSVWTFDNTGNLSIPAGGDILLSNSQSTISAAGNITGNYILGNGAFLTGVATSYGNANVAANLAAFGSNPISTTGNITAGNIIGNISITGNVTGTSSNVQLVAGSYSWTFDNTGNLALPGNTFAVNYANGSAVTLGGNYGNSNVVANLAALGSNPVSTTGNVTAGNLISSGTTATGINAVLAGPTFTPLSNTSAGFVANVNNYTQITFQNKSTGTDATADYILTADNGTDTVNYGDFGIINSGYDNATPTNSLGNIVFAADTYVYAAGNVGNTAQSGGNLVIGTTTAAKTVKIFAGGNTTSALVANISNTGVAVIGAISATGNVTAQNFVGNISITGNVVGTSPNVTITAGSYGWTFDNTGNLQGNITFTGANVLINNSAGAGGSDEGGQLNFAAATANTTLNGPIAIDVYQNKMRFFETTGNNRGAYLDLGQASTSASTLLNNRVSAANLALNTSLTFDNLAIQIRAQQAGVWIFAATVSGTATYQYAITYQLGGGANANTQGTSSTMSATTTPASIGLTSWSFATAAQLVTVVLTDTTANKMYRITWQITTGTSPFGSFVSIERLV